jgi:hypothetical protein
VVEIGQPALAKHRFNYNVINCLARHDFGWPIALAQVRAMWASVDSPARGGFK